MKWLYFGILFLASPTFAQNTPVAEIPNTITICSEPCVVTAISSPSNVSANILQFGVGTTWGPAFTLQASQLPLSVDYSRTNLVLSPFDPAPEIGKTLVAQQVSVPYSVTWVLNGVTTITQIPALIISTMNTSPGIAVSVTTPNFASLLSTAGGVIVLKSFSGTVTLKCTSTTVYSDNSASLNCVIQQPIVGK